MRGYLLLAVIAGFGCGSVGVSPDAAVDAAPTFTVGGMVTGFAGSGLVLRLNGGNDLTITGDGAFSFPSGLIGGTTFTVTVAGEPTC